MGFSDRNSFAIHLLIELIILLEISLKLQFIQPSIKRMPVKLCNFGECVNID